MEHSRRTCQAFLHGGPIKQVVEIRIARSQRKRRFLRSTDTHHGSWCPASFTGKAIEACSPESSTAITRPTRRSPERCFFLTQYVDGECFVGHFMALRMTHAPAQYVTDSSFAELGVNQRKIASTEAVTSAWADLWRGVWLSRSGRGGGEEAHQRARLRRTPLLWLCTRVLTLGLAIAGCWVLGAGCWVLGAGCWAGCWVLGAGCWVLGAGCWVLGAGCWVLVLT